MRRKKTSPPYGKSPEVIQGFLLSYLDSNQDKLIQSQMCYRYTIGQTLFRTTVFECLIRASVFPKTGAKVQTFSILAKLFFICE